MGRGSGPHWHSESQADSDVSFSNISKVSLILTTHITTAYLPLEKNSVIATPNSKGGLELQSLAGHPCPSVAGGEEENGSEDLRNATLGNGKQKQEGEERKRERKLISADNHNNQVYIKEVQTHGKWLQSMVMPRVHRQQCPGSSAMSALV